jgi:hypothetical protein
VKPYFAIEAASSRCGRRPHPPQPHEAARRIVAAPRAAPLVRRRSRVSGCSTPTDGASRQRARAPRRRRGGAAA